MTHFASFLVGVLLLLPSAAIARGDRIDDYITKQMAAHHVAGLSMAVLQDGKIQRTHAYGFASLELHAPASTETVYEIGSISKQFTAMGIMMLVEDGKVTLDDPISKYLPDAPALWKDVTVRHLLTHTSGIPTYTELTGFQVRDHLTQAQFMARLGEHPLDFPPGTKFKYDNSGYNLLGYIIENVSAQDYWDFMRARIWRPLGMMSTRSRDLEPVIPNRAAGYDWKAGQYLNRDGDLTDIFSAGAIVSTVFDLAKWDAALRTERLVKKATLDQIWTPYVLSTGEATTYGFGWRIRTVNGHRRIAHTGSTSGFSAANYMYPEDDGLTVIVLTNAEELDVAAKIAEGVVGLIDSSLVESPTATK